MLSRTALISLSLALALFLAPAARAAAAGKALPFGGKAPAGKALAPLEGDEVLVTADHLEGSNVDRIVIGEGAVTIRYHEMRLVADRVVYNQLTKAIVADGNVVLDSGADRIQGAHLEMNMENRVGFMERAQGFLQTYYFSGERIEKLGPDRYHLSGGTFTTCEGVMPQWSFHATSADVTVDEYLHAWNPTLRIKSVPVLYFPYAIFPVKRDRSTGLLIPQVGLSSVDGFTAREAFYWAPRDNFDATIGLEYLAKTGMAADAEMRYLLAPRTFGVVNAYFLEHTNTEGRRWSLATRNSQELPLGLHAEIDVFFQSDRSFIKTQGNTIEDRSNERTTSTIYINRSWSAWNFALSGRNEVSLLTEQKTTLTRLPELTIDRTSTRLFGTDLYFKLAASGVNLKRDDSKSTVETTRLYVAPEGTWPISLGSVARIIPSAGYGLTYYSENTLGAAETRAIPYFRLSLEGPRSYRIWDLSDGGRFAKLKHLIEPSISYVYIQNVDQTNIPQFDSIDRIAGANRIEYSLTNTMFAKTRVAPTSVAPPVATPFAPPYAPPATAPVTVPVTSPYAPQTPTTTPDAAPDATPEATPDAPPYAMPDATPDATSTTPPDATPDASPTRTTAPTTALASVVGTQTTSDFIPMVMALEATGQAGGPNMPTQLSTTQELLWFKLSQNYTIDSGATTSAVQSFSAIEWEARTRPLTGMEVHWRGNFDVYGKGLGYQNLSLAWRVTDRSSLQADWRSTRDSNQDFLDLGGKFPFLGLEVQARSRYNLAENAFVENRISLKYTSQCWDVTLGYVRWTDKTEYNLLFSLKGIGTIIRI